MMVVEQHEVSPHSLAVQAMPYRAIETIGKYLIIDRSPCSLMVFLPPLHS